jgi:tape measure domain-containing protein
VADENIDIRVRLAGARAAAADAKLVASGIDDVGRAGHRSSAGLLAMKNAGHGLSGTLRSLSGAAKGGAFALGGLSTAAAGFGLKAGLQFNSALEMNTVAFTNFLGSTGKARDYLLDLYQVAKATPFEFPQLVDAAKRFLAFGFSAREAKSELVTVGDVASGLGVGADGIERIVTALGQIRSKGRLQSEELMQLQELGAVNFEDLARRLGLTRKELGNVGEENVSSSRALKALNEQWNKTFGGMSAAQAKTFSGQVSTLKDNVNQLLGAVTKPAFDRLRTRLLPDVNEILGGTVNRNGFAVKASTHDMMVALGGQLKRDASQIWKRDLQPEIAKWHIGDQIAKGISAGVPVIVHQMTLAAPKAAKAFIDSFQEMDLAGKLFVGLLVGAKFGVFRTLGTLAFGRFLGGFSGAGRGAGGLPGWLGPLGAGVAIDASRAYNNLTSDDPVDKATGDPAADLKRRIFHGITHPGSIFHAGGGGGLRTDDPGMRDLIPVQPGGGAIGRRDSMTVEGRDSLTIHLHAHIDGKEVAVSSHRVDRRARANK